jgi:glycerophosphoryl diester phosphodiesterase
MQIIAHRGYSSIAPENTLSALRMALDAGAHAVEFDVQETAESIPVVFHDYRLDRTTDGSGRVNLTPLHEVRDLDAGGWFDPRFAGEPVPTLEAALTMLRVREGEIYIELKAGLSPAAIERTVHLLGEVGIGGRATLISFDWWALRLVREESPGARIGFLVHTADEFDGAVLRAAEVGNALVDCHFPILLDDPRRAGFARDAGVELAVYTVDDPEAAKALLDLGVHRITTNEVTRIASALGGRRRTG